MGRGLKIAKAAALASARKAEEEANRPCKHTETVVMRDKAVLCAHCGKLISLPPVPALDALLDKQD